MTRRKSKTTEETSPDGLSVSELLAQGEQAAQLLDAPIFATAFENTIQMYQDHWIQTLPHETQKRESLYQKVQVASDVAKELAAMVQATQGLNLEELKQTEINPTFQ